MDKTTIPANNAATKTAVLDATHPLAQSIEVFRAGKQIDSRGRETTFTEADLDSMVAAHEAQPAPAVIGHPETTDPAMGWVSSLKRVGGKLYAQFKDWNPTFVDAVDAGGYRNRSVSVSKNGDGWMVNHVGWLGAKLPAVAGMAALAYSANKLEAYEFEALDEATEIPPNSPNPPFLKGAAKMFTQEDLDRTAREAEAKGRTEAEVQIKAEFSKQADGAKIELAALKATVALGGVTNQIEAWSKEGRVLPHERAGMAEFMLGLAAQGQTFSFSKAEGDAATTESTDPAKWFANFMASRKPAVVMGKQDLGGEPAGAAITDPSLLAQKAQTYISEQAAKGIDISVTSAIAHVSKT